MSISQETFEEWFEDIVGKGPSRFKNHQTFNNCIEEILSRDKNEATKNLQKWLQVMWITGFANGIEHVRLVEKIEKVKYEIQNM